MADEPSNEPKNEPDPKNEPSTEPKFKTIESQDDLDRIVEQRLARERSKYADYGDLKAKAEAHDKELEARKTEQEKAVDAARKEGEETARKAAHQRFVRTEARALAAQAGFRSLSDVSLLDLSDVKVGDDDQPDSDAIKAKLEALAKSDPWRVDDGKKPRPKPDGSQGGSRGEEKPSVARGRELWAERHKSRAATKA